jgi:WD40 repeat protein
LLIRHESNVEALAVSADGKLIASFAAGEKGTVRICDAATGKQLHEFSVRVMNLRHLRFSGDGKRLAGAGDDGKVRVWSVENGTLLSESDLQFGTFGDTGDYMFNYFLTYAVFSPDARFLVTEFAGKFLVLSAETGKELRTFGTDGVQQPEMAISADGKLLLSNRRAELDASKSDTTQRPFKTKTHELRLWDLASGKEIWRQNLPGPYEGPVCISADGKRFAVSVGGESPEIQICDLATHRVLQALKSDGHPRCLSFSPDGRLLVAGMENGTALTWDISQ